MQISRRIEIQYWGFHGASRDICLVDSRINAKENRRGAKDALHMLPSRVYLVLVLYVSFCLFLAGGLHGPV